DRLFLTFPRDSAQDGPRPRILEPGLRNGAVWSGWTEPGETKTVTYRVRVPGTAPVRAVLRLDSTPGGVLRREIELGGGGASHWPACTSMVIIRPCVCGVP